MEPELYSLTHSARNRRLLVVAGVVGAISALATSLWWYQTDHGRIALPEQLSLSSIVISAGPFTASALYTGEKNTLTPLEVVVNGETKNVLDKKLLSDGTEIYILIDSKEKFISNLYIKHANSEIKKITDTPSVKSNLDVSPDATHVVYQEGTVASVQELLVKKAWNVIETDIANPQSRTVTNGITPRYLRDGLILVAKSNSIFSFTTTNQVVASGSPILSLNGSENYALSTDRTKIAIYNTKTRKIDLFDVLPTTAMNYVTSVSAASQPAVVGFIGHKIFTLSESVDSGKKSVFKLINISTPSEFVIVQNPLSLIPQRFYEFK